MNKFDIENIQRIIEIRAARFNDKGELDINYLMSLDTEKLVTMISDYFENQDNCIKNQIKSLVDTIFNQCSNNENVIIIDECWAADRDIYQVDSIGMFTNIKQSKYNNWCTTVNLMELPDDIFRLYDKLYTLICNFNFITSVEEEFEEDDRIDDECHGIIAITKDYEIIKFIACDNVMAHEYINKPVIMMKL